MVIEDPTDDLCSLAERLPEVFFTIDSATMTPEYISPGYETLSGRSVESLRRQPLSCLRDVAREDMPKLFAALRRLEEQGGVEVEFRLKPSDGRPRWIRCRIFLAQSSGRYVGIAEDITRRRFSDDQLWHAQKMAGIGRLATSIVHDFNNMLMVLNGYSDEVLRHQGDISPVRREIEEIRNTTGRASALASQLLAVSRRPTAHEEVLDLNELLENFDLMVHRAAGPRVKVVLVPGKDLGRVRANAGQIEQVLLNLVINARDAMPHGGCLTIKTSNREVRQEGDGHELFNGSYVVLSVSDTGSGIPDNVMPHLFEPFFTTKDPEHGTGLGLSIGQSIVEQNGGRILVQSTPGRGSTFEVYLPSLHRHRDYRARAASMSR